MSAGVQKVAGALLLPESAADVPTEDGVLLRVKAGQIQAALKAGGWAGLGVVGEGVISAELHGADRTGLSDSISAIKRARDAAAALGGGIVKLGQGTFRIKGSFDFLSNVRLKGSGFGATRILIDDSGGNIGDAFTMPALHDCGLSNLTIDSVSTRTAGRAVHVSGGDSTFKLGSFNISRAQHFIDVDLNNQYDGILIDDTSATNGNWGCTVGNPRRLSIWRNFAQNRYPYELNSPHGASHVLSNIFVYGNGTPSIGPAAGFRVRGTGDLTAFGLSTWGCVNGLLIDPDGIGAESVMALKFEMSYFDFSSAACVRYNPGAAVAVPIIATFDDVWVASSLTSHGIHGSNPNNIPSQVDFNGCQSLNNAGFGLRGDTNCTAANFANTSCRFGPPLPNTGGATQYV